MVELEVTVDEWEVDNLLDLARGSHALTTLWELVVLVRHPDYADFKFERAHWYNRHQVVAKTDQLQLVRVRLSSPLRIKMEASGPDVAKTARMFASLLEIVRDWRLRRRERQVAVDQAELDLEVQRRLVDVRVVEETAMSELRVRRALAETQLLEQFLAEADRRGALPFLADIMTTEGARALPMATASVEGDTVSDDAGDSPDAGRARRPTAKRSKPKTASKKKAR